MDTPGKVLLIAEIIVYSTLSVVILGWGSGIQYVLFVLPIGVVFQTRWSRWVAVGSAIFCMLLFTILYYYTELRPPLYAVPLVQLAVLNVITIAITIGSIGAATYYLLYEAEQAEMQLEIEYQKSEVLLNNVLPELIAARLKNNWAAIADPSQTQQEGIAESFSDVTVLFADLVGFTPLSEQLTPQETVVLLNEVFTHFDSLVEKYGAEKIRTIGDGYMVAAGVPLPQNNHAQALLHMALDMQQYMKRREFTAKVPLQLRIGINSGPAVAGIVGTTKFHYDLWGDMVNTASRMESHGVPGKIQIARPTYQLIKEEFQCEPRGTVAIKGKGNMDAWFVTGVVKVPTGDLT